MKVEAKWNKNKYLSFLYLSLGVNVTALPFSLFKGGIAIDPPDSDNFNFIRGFFIGSNNTIYYALYKCI
jgi:hypothetical protein